MASQMATSATKELLTEEQRQFSAAHRQCSLREEPVEVARGKKPSLGGALLLLLLLLQHQGGSEQAQRRWTVASDLVSSRSKAEHSNLSASLSDAATSGIASHSFGHCSR